MKKHATLSKTHLLGSKTLKNAMKAVALSLALTAMSGIAAAQSTATITGEVTDVEDTGQLLDAGIILRADTSTAGTGGTVNIEDDGTPWTYDLMGASAEIVSAINAAQTAGAAIIVTNDSTGIFTLGTGDFKINTSASQMTGFLYAGNDDFGGTISGTANIFVTNSGRATGVGFVNADGTSWANLADNTTISFGNITVSGGTDDNTDNQGVEGFAAGASGANITLGTIEVNGKANSASGVYFGGDMSGSLETKGITITGGDAFGIQIGNFFDSSPISGNLTGTIVVDGDIIAQATGRAYGIIVNGDVSGSVTVDNIDVQGGSAVHPDGTSAAAAAGFAAAGTVTGTVNLGNITAVADDGNGKGIANGFLAQKVDGAEITLGSLVITGADGAAGIAIGDGGFIGKLTTGTINVQGGEGTEMTAGIAVDGEFSLTEGSIGDIVAAAKTSEHVYGIVTTGTKNVFTANTITVTNSGTGSAMGIDLKGTDADSNVAAGNISAVNEGMGQAFGVRVDGNVGGSITLEDIDVQGGSAVHPDGKSAAAAVGFAASGTVTGKVAIGNITAAADDGNGKGIANGFLAQKVDGAEITLGSLEITGADGAAGIGIGNGGFIGKLTTGTINVQGGEGTEMTAGIAVDGEFTLTEGSIGAITAAANTSENVYGIVTTGTKNVFTATDISVKNSGTGGAMGIDLKGTGTDSNVAAGNISAVNEGTGQAFGVRVDGNVGGTLKTGDISAASDHQAYGFAVTGNAASSTIELGNVNVTGREYAAGWQFEGNVGGTLKSGDITIKTEGDSDEVSKAIGLYVKGNLKADTEGLGKIDVTSANGGQAFGIFIDGDTESDFTITQDITAKSDNQAYGFFVDGKAANSTITLGKIFVGNEEDADIRTVRAVGFAAGEVDSESKINLGDIEARGNEAVGAFFAGHVAGDVTVKSALVNARDKAYGVYVGRSSDTINAAGELSVGNLNVTSENEDAFGVRVNGAADKLTLTGDISVSGKGTETSGIYTAGAAAMTLTENVKIETDYTGSGTWAGADIWAKNKLDINLNSKNLTTSSVKVDSDEMIVRGAGTAKLGTVKVAGSSNFTVGGSSAATRVELDIYKSDLGTGTKTVDAGATLAVYSEAEETSLRDFEYDFSKWTLGTSGSDYSRINRTSDPLNIWNLNTTTGILTYGGRKVFARGEGYLAALGMHNRYTAWNAVRDRMISGSGRGNRAGYYGQAACSWCGQSGYDPYAPQSTYTECNCGTRNTWVNYVRRDGSPYNRNWTLAMNGAQAGADIIKTRCEQVGLFFGYEEGKMTNAGERVNADDLYFGIYAAYVLCNGTDIRGVFAYGWQDYTLSRLHNNSYDNPYSSSFKGNTVETSLEIGRRISDGTWSMRPVLAVDIMNNDLTTATEFLWITSSLEEAFVYRKTDLTQVLFRLGSDWQCQAGNFAFNGGLYYSYDLKGSRLNTLVRQEYGETDAPLSSLVGPKLGRSLLNFNATGSWQIARGFSVIGGYQGEYALDGGSKMVHASHIGGMWKW